MTTNWEMQRQVQRELAPPRCPTCRRSSRYIGKRKRQVSRLIRRGKAKMLGGGPGHGYTVVARGDRSPAKRWINKSYAICTDEFHEREHDYLAGPCIFSCDVHGRTIKHFHTDGPGRALCSGECVNPDSTDDQLGWETPHWHNHLDLPRRHPDPTVQARKRFEKRQRRAKDRK